MKCTLSKKELENEVLELQKVIERQYEENQILKTMLKEHGVEVIGWVERD